MVFEVGRVLVLDLGSGRLSLEVFGRGSAWQGTTITTPGHSMVWTTTT